MARKGKIDPSKLKLSRKVIMRTSVIDRAKGNRKKMEALSDCFILIPKYSSKYQKSYSHAVLP